LTPSGVVTHAQTWSAGAARRTVAETVVATGGSLAHSLAACPG
jgi:hypothetical protein